MASAGSSGALTGHLGALYHLGVAGTLTDGQLLERFLTRDDPAASEAAFTALVDRHGAMVLAVCRKILGDAHDAHDAFQATFLVLVNRAGSIRNRESVAGWLLGIARRVAARARVDEARRTRHLRQFGQERTSVEDAGSGPIPDDPEPDFGPLIAEVDRLPERFRAPVVLHYFEGLSAEATAQRLGCARGTVLSRLARARGRIKQRLDEQGVSFTALIPAGDALTRWIPPAPVPAGLAQTTIKAAGALGLAGAAIENVVPATVAALSRGVGRALLLTRLRATATVLVLAVAGVSIGLAATYPQTDEPGRAAPEPSPSRTSSGPIAGSPAVPPEDKAQDARLVFRGRVLDPDGKPVAKARVLLSLPVVGPGTWQSPQPLGISDLDGRFTVSVAREILDHGSGGFLVTPVIAALAPGFGPDWAAIVPKSAGAEITLRLRRDDVPIEGRIIGLEGRPLRDLTVRAAHIAEFPRPLLDKLRENAGKMNPELWGEMRNALVLGQDGPVPAVQTGPDGRFRLTGIGRDRVVLVLVEGQSIEQSHAMVSTSADPAYQPLLLPGDGSGKRRLERSRFDLSVAPGRDIQGIVRDVDTRQPIAGARVHSWSIGSTTTDGQGKFQIAGQSMGGENYLYVEVDGQPYLKVVQPVPIPPGAGPIPAEITLKRGRWVEGRVKNAVDGRPVKAVIQYYPSRDNPHLPECPDAAFLNNNVSDEPEFPTDAEGRFRAMGLPGRGFLVVKTAPDSGYVSGPKIDPKLSGQVLSVGDFQYQIDGYQAVVAIEVPAEKDLTVPDIALAPGRPQHLRILDADGRPVAGTKIACSQGQPFSGEAVAGSDYTFIHRHPGKPETLAILQAERSLGAAVELKGDEPDPVRVVLEPAGRITGRLVDEEGRPRPNVELSLQHRLKSHGSSSTAERFDPVFTGPDGRFQIKNLVPGISYSIYTVKKNERNFSLRDEGYLHKPSWIVKPGEVVDWGEVQVQRFRP